MAHSWPIEDGKAGRLDGPGRLAWQARAGWLREAPGSLHGPKPDKLIGDLHGPKPCEVTRFGDLHGPEPYKFIGFLYLYRSFLDFVPTRELFGMAG